LNKKKLDKFEAHLYGLMGFMKKKEGK